LETAGGGLLEGGELAAAGGGLLEGGELAVRLVGLCTVLFAVVVGGEIGAAIFGDGGAVTVS
jgi:hypothetical protein